MILKIHLWCDTCWLYRGQLGSQAFLIHIPADMSTSIDGGLGLEPMTVRTTTQPLRILDFQPARLNALTHMVIDCSYWQSFPGASLARNPSHCVFFSDFNSNSSYRNKWVVRDSMKVFTLCDWGNITNSNTVHYEQKQIAVANHTVWTGPNQFFF